MQHESGMSDRATVTNGGRSLRRVNCMEKNDLCILQNISIGVPQKKVSHTGLEHLRVKK